MLKKLAEALGLPADTADDKILAAASALILEGADSKKKLEGFSAQLTALGIKVDGEKLVKLAEDNRTPAEKLAQPNPADDAEKKQLKITVSNLLQSDRKNLLAAAKKEAEEAVKLGRIPPALAAKVEELLSIAGQGERVMLAADGQATTKAVDVVGTVRELLAGLPSITSKERLSQLADAPTDDEVKDRQALSTKARQIAERVGGVKKKKETAGAK